MKGRRSMGQSKNGYLAWSDVATLLDSYDALHGTTSTLTLSHDGSRGRDQWTLRITSSWPMLIDASAPVVLTTWCVWPSVDHKTMEGAVYALIVRHDDRTGEMYRQSPLWKKIGARPQ